MAAYSASTNSQRFLEYNPHRQMVSIYNGSRTNLFIRLGQGVTPQTYTVKLVPGAHYELPLPPYKGMIEGVWDIALPGDYAQITEQQ